MILQASDRVGGRIRTEQLSEIINSEGIKHSWINSEVKNTWVEVGATWISKDHSYILKMI